MYLSDLQDKVLFSDSIKARQGCFQSNEKITFLSFLSPQSGTERMGVNERDWSPTCVPKQQCPLSRVCVTLCKYKSLHIEHLAQDTCCKIEGDTIATTLTRQREQAGNLLTEKHWGKRVRKCLIQGALLLVFKGAFRRHFQTAVSLMVSLAGLYVASRGLALHD